MHTYSDRVMGVQFPHRRKFLGPFACYSRFIIPQWRFFMILNRDFQTRLSSNDNSHQATACILYAGLKATTTTCAPK